MYIRTYLIKCLRITTLSMTALDEGSSTGSFIKLPIRASQNSLGACVCVGGGGGGGGGEEERHY